MEKKYILCRRVSGLGDMLQQLAHCDLLAERLNLPLFVDWRNVLYSDKYSTNLNLFGKYVFSPDALPVESLVASNFCSEKDEIHSGLYCSNTKAVELWKLIDQKINADDIAGDCSGLIIQNPIKKKDISLLYKHLRKVTFSKEIRDIADALISEIGGGYNAIHYRHGNGEFSDFKSYDDHFSEIEEILSLYQGSCEDTEYPIYIATDSKEAESIFKEVFSGFPNLYFSKQLITEKNGAIHYSSIGSDCNNVNMHDVFISTVVDMLVLSKSNVILRDPRSSFSNYSCALASRSNDFREIHYSFDRKKFSEHSSKNVYDSALDKVALRFKG